MSEKVNVVVASTSPLKIKAVELAFRSFDAEAKITAINTKSGVNEQPMGDETIEGAYNRMRQIKEQAPGADFYVAIENGLFFEDDEYIDKAVVLMSSADGAAHVETSRGVAFPTEMVRIAQERGFDKTTVGAVMKENGVVFDAADPHLALTGVSRRTLLTDTIHQLLEDHFSLPKNPTFPVTFKADDVLLYQTSVELIGLKGEPLDTCRIYTQGIRNLQQAVRQKEVRQDALEIGNTTIIGYPDGQTKTYSEAEMAAVFNAYHESIKVQATRAHTIRLSLEGGFTGGDLDDPIVVSLAHLSDKDFARVVTIVNDLQTPSIKKEYADGGGDFGYYVRMGLEGQSWYEDAKVVFNGGPFSRTPLIVEELKEILGAYEPPAPTQALGRALANRVPAAAPKPGEQK